MKVTKFLVLISGVVGILSFFLPMVAVKDSGIEGKLSAYRIVVGIDKASQVINTTAADSGGKAMLADANEQLKKVRGIVLGIYAPAALLLLLGGIGVARGKFGRGFGVLALLFGLIGLGIAALLLSAAKDNEAKDVAGVGLYVMFMAAALGGVGGLLALIKPDRG